MAGKVRLCKIFIYINISNALPTLIFGQKFRMDHLTPTAFEALHIATSLLSKFDAIFEKCDLKPMQLYTLVIIDAVGKPYSIKGKTVKILPEDYIRTILKNVFRCSAPKVSKWLDPLKKHMVEEHKIDKDSKRELFDGIGRRQNVLYLLKAGNKKIEQVVKELKSLKDEITDGETNVALLRIPNSKEFGTIAKGLLFFLSDIKS